MGSTGFVDFKLDQCCFHSLLPDSRARVGARDLQRISLRELISKSHLLFRRLGGKSIFDSKKCYWARRIASSGPKPYSPVEGGGKPLVPKPEIDGTDDSCRKTHHGSVGAKGATCALWRSEKFKLTVRDGILEKQLARSYARPGHAADEHHAPPKPTRRTYLHLPKIG